jgi:hypothetical protein
MKDTYPNKVGLAPAATAGSGNAPVLIFNELMNLLIKILVRLGLLKRDLDYHVVRASNGHHLLFLRIPEMVSLRSPGFDPFFQKWSANLLDVPGFRHSRIELVFWSF